MLDRFGLVLLVLYRDIYKRLSQSLNSGPHKTATSFFFLNLQLVSNTFPRSDHSK